jgi:hypothetical protein
MGSIAERVARQSDQSADAPPSAAHQQGGVPFAPSSLVSLVK